MAAKTTPARDSTSTAGTPVSVTPSGVVETRIDAPHQFSVVSSYENSTELDELAENRHAPTTETAGIDFAELRVHARQIAGQLRARKEDLDRREAEVARQLADFDKEVRQLRLWADDQRGTLQDRDERMQHREATIERQIDWLIQYGDTSDPRPLPEAVAGIVTDPKLIAVAEVLRRWHAERSAMETSRTAVREQREAIDAERRRLEQEIVSQREVAMQSVRAALEQVEVRRGTLDRREEVLRADEQEWGLRRDEPTTTQIELSARLDKRERELQTRFERIEKERLRVEAVVAGLADERAQIAQERKGMFVELDDERAKLTREREQVHAERAAIPAQMLETRQQIETERETLRNEQDDFERRRSSKKQTALAELKSERAKAREQMLAERAELQVELKREYDLFLEQTKLERERLQEEFRIEQIRLREENVNERDRIVSQARLDRQRLLEEQRRSEHELLAKRQIVEQAAEELDHRRLALQNEHAEVLRLHQESLELRLATEELASQLSQGTPSSELSLMMSKTRQRLANHFRVETAEIERRLGELARLQESLKSQLQLLDERCEQFDGWANARQQDLDQQASSLLTREQQFEAQANEARQLQDRAQCQRMELEQELRRLQGELRVAKLRENPPA